MRERSNAISSKHAPIIIHLNNEPILLAAETPALGTTITQNLISEHEMERLKILKQAKSGEPLHTRPLVRQGGFKRKLMRAVSSADPSKNIDIVLETENYPRQFSNPLEKQASIRKAKVNNIRRAAVCSLYLQEREKRFSDGGVSPNNGMVDLTPSPQGGRPSVFSPNIPLITQPTTNLKKRPQKSWRLSDLDEDYQEEEDFAQADIPNALSRSRSFVPHRKTRTREAARTNSCLARYICLPEMSVRDEIKWARRSIKLYREFSQLSSNNRTDSYLNLDLFFSDDFDKSDSIFQAVEEEDKDAEDNETDEMDVDETENTAFDIFYNLSSLYRTTCPYKRFGENKLKFPFGVCCNPDGTVFVSDWEAGLIYQLENIEDELQGTVKFPTALGMCTVGDDLYITSEQDQHLYLTTNRDEMIQQDLGRFSSPDGICYLNDKIYVVEENNNRISCLTPQGQIVSTFGDNNGSMSLNKPGGITVYPEKGLLVVCDRGNKRIALWDTEGSPRDVIPLTQHPDCCSYAGAGILVVGTSEGEVMFVDLDCKQHVFSWTNKQLKYPGFITGVAVDNRQNVYICDPKNHRVIKVYK